MLTSALRRELTAPEHFQQDHGRRAVERFISGLEQDRIREVDLTNLICAADGRLERSLVRRFFAAGGDGEAEAKAEEVDAGSGLPRFRMVAAHDLDPATRRRGGRRISIVPDVFVGERVHRAAGSARWRPRIAVEVKLGAMVNSRFGYCPAGVHIPANGAKGLSHYSSQVICYPEHCWLSEDAPVPDAYVWLGPNPRLVGPAFIEREHVQSFALAQVERLAMWRCAGLDEVVGPAGAMAEAGLEHLQALLQERLALSRR